MNSAVRPPLWHSLYVQVMAGIALGVLIGVLWPHTGAALKPVADAFIGLLRMVITPLIFLTLVTGFSHLKNVGELGRITWKALAYFLILSTFALVLGLVVANLLRPGAGLHIDPATLDTSKVGGYIQTANEQSLAAFLLGVIPTTLPSALMGGNILQVLLVAILVGVSAMLVGARAQAFLVFCDSALAIVFRLIELLMRLTPVAACAGMAYTVGSFGPGTLRNLGLLVAAFYGTSLVFVVVVLGAVARLNGFRLWRLLRYLKDELLLVFGTSSSESALPRLIEKMEAAGCDRAVVGVVVPAGYSFNLDGTNIYLTLAALFIARATDIPLSFGQQAGLLLVAILSSKGAAGVTGAGFITLAATLAVVPSVPVAGLALIFGIDRFMSECRSLTNFVGNAVATVVISRWEGAFDRSRFDTVTRGDPT